MPESHADSTPPHHDIFTRRSALGVLGASGLAWIGSTLPGAAGFFGGGVSRRVDLSGLPSDWVRRQGRTLTDYADFLGSLRLRRITPLQIIEAHAKKRGSVWNMLPPKSMWRNIAPTFKVIDRVGSELDQPVREIVSAYRSPAYNARCPGAKSGSWHKSNVAVDVQFGTHPATVTAVARRLRSRGMFKGGIGRYSGFVHIDTRGQNCDW